MGTAQPVAHAYRPLGPRWDRKELGEDRDKVASGGGALAMASKPGNRGATAAMPSAARILAKVVAAEVWEASGGVRRGPQRGPQGHHPAG